LKAERDALKQKEESVILEQAEELTKEQLAFENKLKRLKEEYKAAIEVKDKQIEKFRMKSNSLEIQVFQKVEDNDQE